jgi:hypothetical protein
MRMNLRLDCCVFVCDELLSVSKPVWVAGTVGSGVTEFDSTIGSRDLFVLIALLGATFWRTMVHETGRERARTWADQGRAWAEV